MGLSIIRQLRHIGQSSQFTTQGRAARHLWPEAEQALDLTEALSPGSPLRLDLDQIELRLIERIAQGLPLPWRHDRITGRLLACLELDQRRIE